MTKRKRANATPKLYNNRLQILVSDLQYRKLVTLSKTAQLPMGAVIRLLIDDAKQDSK